MGREAAMNREGLAGAAECPLILCHPGGYQHSAVCSELSGVCGSGRMCDRGELSSS